MKNFSMAQLRLTFSGHIRKQLYFLSYTVVQNGFFCVRCAHRILYWKMLSALQITVTWTMWHDNAFMLHNDFRRGNSLSETIHFSTFLGKKFCFRTNFQWYNPWMENFVLQFSKDYYLSGLSVYTNLDLLGFDLDMQQIWSSAE